MNVFVPPLKVHICWFESGDSRCAAIARNIYEFLHRPLSDDPVLPLTGLPQVSCVRTPLADDAISSTTNS